MKKIPAIVALMVTITLFLSACGPQQATPAVIAQDTRPQGIIAEGRLLPSKILDQSFQIAGQVEEVLVQDGEAVAEGQALARLKSSPEMETALLRARQETLAAQQALDLLQAEAQVNLAKGEVAYQTALDELDRAQTAYDNEESDLNQARLLLAQANLQRAEDILTSLKSGQGIDPNQMAAAQARLDSANAALAGAQAMLKNLTLTATLSGVVVGLSLQPGERVMAGAPVATIVDGSSWLVKTDNLTEIDVTRVKLDQRVDVVLDALPEMTFAGRVTHVDSRYELKRGDITFTVTIQLDEFDPQMRWGMTAATIFEP